ncbi:MAG: cysteine--tRNA ligase [Candidatus Aenigmarchaeota archaeon]|nr:cysteine--tRNA ligase [Candidatus Aenigmarchaeota archaeon]
MALRLFNTLTRKKEAFRPLEDRIVKLYTCGPTVYDFAHIGNFRAYVAQDLLKRYLLYKGYKVRHVMNLTDVDDKTIKGSREKKMSLREYTEFYTKAFFEDLQRLNILKAEIICKATDHIQEMVQLTKKLLEKGIAYTGQDGSIYFSISKFPSYGQFANLDLSGLKPGARVSHDTYTKDSVSDFALWKAYGKDDGKVFWETEIGKGRPGWHIECSAMSMKYLGETFDIHAGGVDLVFPHHQNEIAQSEAATGRQFVKYWAHNEHLIVNGQKMSKSLGNFYTLRDLAKHDSMAIRFALLATHYKQQLDFSFSSLEQAKANIEKLRELMRSLKATEGTVKGDMEKLIEETKKSFERAMDDDLNIAKAIASVHQFAKEVNILISEKQISREQAAKGYEFMLRLDSILGLRLEDVTEEWKLIDSAPQWLREAVAQREDMRKGKKFRESDELREAIRKKGILIEDTDEGVRWRKA